MIELELFDMAHGGAAVGRVDGKVHFVHGAMPGERVRGVLARDAGRWAAVALADVISASPDRIEPACPHFGDCGGCQWQFASYDAQLRWKQSILAGQLGHLGGVAGPVVHGTLAPGPPFGYRNRMDFRIAGAAPALATARSRDLVAVPGCRVMHPDLADLVAALGPLDGVESLTVRVGVHTGERAVVVRGALPDGAERWPAAVGHQVGPKLREINDPVRIHEEAAGHRYRISGTAFFQANTDGATALVGLVTDALQPEPADVLLDAYAGGGLFGVALGGSVAEVIAVESAATAVADLVHNLEEADVEAIVVEGAVEHVAAAARPSVDLIVADPPRRGLGRAGVDALTSLGPRAIAYVSCDPASLGRDARLLADSGYRFDWAAPVDMFPQTFHVEAVARFTPTVS